MIRFHNRAIEQRGILRNERNGRAQTFLRNFGNILAVNGNFAFLNIVITRQKLDQRRFSGTGTSDQSDFFARRNMQIKIIEQGFGMFVMISDAGKIYPPFPHF